VVETDTYSIGIAEFSAAKRLDMGSQRHMYAQTRILVGYTPAGLVFIHFIQQSVLRQVQSLFQSELST